jgi:threonine synthase
MPTIECTNCHQPYPAAGTPYRCPRCGGIFDDAAQLIYDPNSVEPDKPGIWRYRYAFSLPDDAPILSLGEGHTPLLDASLFGRHVSFKCEYQNPSGSFKDRGSAPLVSFLRSRGIETAVEDSSGNAGASFTAYAARAGIKARVYVPDSASGPKRQQIEAYGAEVVAVPGPRSNAAEAVRNEADRGTAYASHAYLPFNLPGYATAAFEIADQIGYDLGSVVVPAGQGGLLLGMGRGFEAMLRAGRIRKMPILVGVQARACAPLWAVSNYGPAGLAWVSEAPTLAEGVRVSHPLRGDVLLNTMTRHQGFFLSVDEAEILHGWEALAGLGFYVEPTSALVWGALQQVSEQLPEPVVAVLTGSGLKGLKS